MTRPNFVTDYLFGDEEGIRKDQNDIMNGNRG